MESTLQIILSILTAVATGIIGWLLNKFKKYEERREAFENSRLEEITKREEAINQALRALCRDRILQGYRYYKKSGEISTQDLETMTKLYNAYHNLGGNGTITAVYEKILQLHIKEGG